MNINSKLINALACLNLPVEPDVYEGTKEEYIVFEYILESDELYAGNQALESSTAIRVHYFVKGNPMPKKYKIKKLLQQAGFTVPSMTQFFEDDSKYTHVVYDAWILDE